MIDIRNLSFVLGLLAVTPQAAVLWDVTVPDYQVQVPCVTGEIGAGPTTDENGDGSIDTYDCAGWWYGYGFGSFGASYSPRNSDGSLVMSPVSASCAMDGSLVSNCATSIQRNGLFIILSAPAGASDAPVGAGISFRYNKPEYPIDLSFMEGYTITYSATAALHIELAWPEDSLGYDTWYAILPAGNNITKYLPWDTTITDPIIRVSGRWKKDGWSNGSQSHPITIAIHKATGLRIRLRNGTATHAEAEFLLHELRTYEGDPAAIHSAKSGGSGPEGLLQATADQVTFQVRPGAKAALDLISMDGRFVRNLFNRTSKGKESIHLDPANIPAGIHIVRLRSEGKVVTRIVKN